MSWNDLRKGRFSQANNHYFLTFNINGRQSHFLRSEIVDSFISVLKAYEGKSTSELLAWVIMPDHFHCLLTLGGESLSAAVRNLKGSSSRVINKLLNNDQRFWQPGFYDHALRKDEDIRSVAEYIVNNPVRAGLVDHWPAWPYHYLRYEL